MLDIDYLTGYASPLDIFIDFREEVWKKAKTELPDKYRSYVNEDHHFIVWSNAKITHEGDVLTIKVEYSAKCQKSSCESWGSQFYLPGEDSVAKYTLKRIIDNDG